MDNTIENQTPLVSVLMPAYNADKYIKEAIDSIIAHTYTHWELIVVNDGSTDNTKEIILAYSDPRIRYLENEKNSGIGITLNNAIDAAIGNYCARLDADDVCYPERFAKQVHFLETHPDYGIYGSWAKNSDNTISKLPTHNLDIKCGLLAQCCFVHSSVMIRSVLLKKYKYDCKYNYAEDYNLWEQLSHDTKMANSPECLIYYRITSNNISNTQGDKMKSLARDIYSRQLSSLNITPTDAEMRIHELMVPVLIFADTLKNDPTFFPELKLWMHKLWKANQQTAQYDRSALGAYLWFRWLLACLFLKKTNKMLSLGIWLTPKALWRLVMLLWERMKTRRI